MVGDRNAHNLEAIESYGAVSVLGEMPTLTPLDSNSVRQWRLVKLDNEGVLVDHLRLAHHERLRISVVIAEPTIFWPAIGGASGILILRC